MENCAASAVQMLACVTTKNAPRCDGLVNALCDCCATQVGRLRMPAPLLMKHKQIFWGCGIAIVPAYSLPRIPARFLPIDLPRLA